MTKRYRYKFIWQFNVPKGLSSGDCIDLISKTKTATGINKTFIATLDLGNDLLNNFKKTNKSMSPFSPFLMNTCFTWTKEINLLSRKKYLNQKHLTDLFLVSLLGND